MRNDREKIVREFLAEIGRKGGQMRAKKYDKATLRKWGRKGRPALGEWQEGEMSDDLQAREVQARFRGKVQ